MSDTKTCDSVLVEKRAEEIRELVFQAQSIVALASSAAIADVKPNNWAMQKALDTADELLDQVATLLEPNAITATDDVTEASHE